MYTNLKVIADVNDPGIIIVSIYRPERLNAINRDTLMELQSLFTVDLPSRLDSVKVVIITGSGDRSFSSGLDLTCPSVAAIFAPPDGVSPGKRANELKTIIDSLQTPMIAISKFPRPVICAVNGLCVGLGVDIASACDIRVACSTSKFSVREVKIGICADLGSLYFLPRICRSDSWVREICFTGRFFGAAEARDNGFVSLVSTGSAVDAALTLAREIAENALIAVEGTKVNLNQGSRDGMLSAMDYVSVWNSIKVQEVDVITEAIGKVLASKGGSSSRAKL